MSYENSVSSRFDPEYPDTFDPPIDYGYVEPFDDPLNELINEDPDAEYFDDDAPSFKLKNAGIFLEPQTVLQVMDKASGRYNYFQRLGQVEGKNSSRALAIAKKQIGEIAAILKPALTEQGVPEEKLSQEVDRIMSELRELYSGTQAKRDAWERDRETLLADANSELKKKKLQPPLGEAALSNEEQLFRQRPLDGFDEDKVA